MTLCRSPPRPPPPAEGRRGRAGRQRQRQTTADVRNVCRVPISAAASVSVSVAVFQALLMYEALAFDSLLFLSSVSYLFAAPGSHPQDARGHAWGWQRRRRGWLWREARGDDPDVRDRLLLCCLRRVREPSSARRDREESNERRRLRR